MSCWAKKGSESAASRLRKLQKKPAAKPLPVPASPAPAAAPTPPAAAASSKGLSVQNEDVFGLADHVGDKIRFFLKEDGLSDSDDPTLVEGVLFAYYHGLLVLQELDPKNYIKDLSVLPNIYHAANASFYDDQVAKERKRRETIGNNVSAEAQQIFDILRQTFPMKWQEPQMIIMPGPGQTVLSPPYTSKQLSGKDGQALATLSRFLNGIRKKHKFAT